MTVNDASLGESGSKLSKVAATSLLMGVTRGSSEAYLFPDTSIEYQCFKHLSMVNFDHRQSFNSLCIRRLAPTKKGEKGEEPTATVTTDGTMNISQTGATLSGSYSLLTGSVTEVGFRWGTSSGKSASDEVRVTPNNNEVAAIF